GVVSLFFVMGMVVSLGGIACLPLLLMDVRARNSYFQAMLICIVTVVLYQWGISSLIQYQADRYRIPIIPFLAISLALAILRGGGSSWNSASGKGHCVGWPASK